MIESWLEGRSHNGGYLSLLSSVRQSQFATYVLTVRLVISPVLEMVVSPNTGIPFTA